MAKYEKWLGAGLGWVITGNPLGGFLGFLAGKAAESAEERNPNNNAVSDFEVNLLVLASYMIKLDGKISLQEINFTNRFMNTRFNEKFSDKRAQILQHCLQKDYDLNTVCEQLRMYTKHQTRIQVIQFLFELAAADGEVSERENFFIFKLAGYLNINDVDFRRIKSGLSQNAYPEAASVYEILEVQSTATIEEIRTSYRKLVLKYHPDRNGHLSEQARKQLSVKLQQVQQAYNAIKQQRGQKT